MDINDLLLKYKDELPKEYTDDLIEKSYPVSAVIKMFIDYNEYLSNNKKNKFINFSLKEKTYFFDSVIYPKIKTTKNGTLKIKDKYLKKAFKAL